MALRSDTRTAVPTSGPGRGPDSDGRTRHRRPPQNGRAQDSRVQNGRARHRASVPAEELRRRAGLLFGEPPVESGESGNAPPGGARARYQPRYVRAPLEEPEPPPPGPDWRERAGLALRERMPLWLQTRCGVERRGVIALTVVLLVAAALAAQHFWSGRTQTVSAPEVVHAKKPFAGPEGSGGVKSPVTVAGSAPPGGQIVVDVGGKVREPGIRELPAGSRVADALKAAGGMRPGVSAEGLNRARFLVDGEQILVGSTMAPAAPPGPAGGGGTGGPASPVSLNTATAEQLDTLPGVGPVLAQHILDYRTRHGGFRAVEELKQVNGIGDSRFSDLKPLVRP
ncbi:ComEA family DNA-binding protein [Streptomyces sp. DSM 110735]|uniref:ComEA family DNA-binding protein n=1 Tax=Streptomyces sp. DSM 110735 TaxID=2775031 RepID=UPI0018F344FE|nr:ComEA family DNA-binding protein [Streptomyces sp. DSM 110735]MBJ7903656.1 ComEA family DNA-binding protein [Streptomyces sp. DSM 110735]